MNLSPDYIIERRRNKRSLLKWKAGIIALIFVVVFFASNGSRDRSFSKITTSVSTEEYIAEIEISDIIMEDNIRLEKLNDIAKDPAVKALIVTINSPGGSMVGSEMLYDSLRKVADKKPVVSVLGSIAASGGYMAAIAADHIIAYHGTITGSVGVVMEHAEITNLAEKIGVTFNQFKSGELKAAPSFTEKTTPNVRAAIMENINRTSAYFINLVATRRNLNEEQIRSISDGRIYSGIEAFDMKLIDEIGNYDSAKDWLNKKHNISQDIKVKKVNINPKPKLSSLLFEEFESVANKMLFNFNALGLQALYR